MAMAIRWTKEKEEQLIALVFDNPAIWDKTLEQHKNTKFIGQLWLQIAVQLKVTKDQAKNKWKSMQTQFVKELAKQPKSKSGDAAKISQVGWCHFQAMSFLKDTKFKESSGNLDLDMVDESQHDLDYTDDVADSSNINSTVLSESTTAINQCEDPLDKGEWDFLLSTLPYLNKISGTEKKMQCRIDGFFLLYNILTDDKITGQLKDQTHEKTVGIQLNHNEKIKSEKQTTQKVPHQKASGSQSIKKEGINNHDAEVIVIDDDDEEIMIDNHEIEPSTEMKCWLLKNPYLLKKEIEFE